MTNVKMFFVLVVLFLAGNSYSQTFNISKFNLAYTSGFSYNFDAKSADFHFQNIDFGYNIQNHEIGISVGQNEDFWYGLYYKFYLPLKFNVGYKIGKITERYPDDIYNEFTIGKDFSVVKDFSLRTNIYFSSPSENPLFIKNAESKIGFSLGMKYAF